MPSPKRITNLPNNNLQMILALVNGISRGKVSKTSKRFRQLPTVQRHIKNFHKRQVKSAERNENRLKRQIKGLKQNISQKTYQLKRIKSANLNYMVNRNFLLGHINQYNLNNNNLNEMKKEYANEFKANIRELRERLRGQQKSLKNIRTTKYKHQTAIKKSVRIK